MKINKNWLIILLGILAALGPFSIAMYIPGFSAMAKDFGVESNQIAFTITSYFIGITIGQLVFGPLIDKFGRKKPLVISLIIYVLASLLCAISQSLDMIVISRFLQALGGSSGMVSAMAIITDVYEPKDRAKALSLVMLVLGIAPIISPSLGSFFVEYINWQSNFYFLVIYGIILTLAIIFTLPETKQFTSNVELSVGKVFHNYKTVITNKSFLFYAIGGSLSNSIIFVFVTSSPFIFMGIYKIDAPTFALIYGFCASGVMLGSYINGLLVKSIDYIKLLNTASIVLVCLSIIFVLIVQIIPNITYEWVALGLFLVLTCMGIVYPNAITASLIPFKALTGSASALVGSFLMALSAIVTAVIGMLPETNPFTMFMMMVAMSLISLLCLQIAKKIKPVKNEGII